ncbi:hypothetical protein HJ590_04355 [Naumannella sp. ID2617S]|uniref:Uncharacterized protein n=1 Tax=Enemella dayhoffiae TaxID=2016507 RepID=A0A255GWT2_9ACTN|nr:hypothetical protein [Enemella dayhoffiae]NNG18811.1 hypothetical protein [Naumannella sp. ID2617S]OYO19426.1 hypothetical protein CGZ93_13815 [Enemella dayhoffiae]
MPTGEQASYPIKHWEGAGKYIADLLNDALKKSGTNSDQDKKDLDDSELMKHWKERGSSLHSGGDFQVRVFDENANCFTSTKKVSFWELPDGWAKYLLDLRNYQTKVWNELVDCWNSNYLYHLNSPKTLWDKAELWKEIKTKEMDNLNTDVGKMQLQTSWVGSGATAYGNAIGVQTQAFTKITELVQASGGALNDGSSGLQRFYLTVAQCAIQMKSEMEMNQPPTKEDMGYRTRVGISVFKNCKDYFDNDLKEGIRTWSGQVDDGVTKLKDAIANERPFKGQEWPKIDGDLSEMEPGPSAPGMPSPTMPTTPTPDTTTPDMPVQPDNYGNTDMDDASYGDSKL